MSCKNDADDIGAKHIESSGVPGVGVGASMLQGQGPAFPEKWKEMRWVTRAKELKGYLTLRERNELDDYERRLDRWINNDAGRGMKIMRHLSVPPEKNEAFFNGCAPGDLIQVDFYRMPFREFADLAAQHGVEVEYIAPGDPAYKRYGSEMVRVVTTRRHIPVAPPWMKRYWEIYNQMASAEEAERAAKRELKRVAVRLAEKGLRPSDLEAYGSSSSQAELEMSRAKFYYGQTLPVVRAIVENSGVVQGKVLRVGDYILIDKQLPQWRSDNLQINQKMPVRVTRKRGNVLFVREVTHSGTDGNLFEVKLDGLYYLITEQNARRFGQHRKNFSDYQHKWQVYFTSYLAKSNLRDR